MPHAFRSAAAIEAEAAQKKLTRLADRWASTRESWFDGSVDSIDRRIGWINEVIATAKSTASRLAASQTGVYAMSLLPQLKADKNVLEANRDTMLASWFPGGDQEAGQFNIDPRLYPSREDWMDASNLSSYIGDAQERHPAADHPIPEHVQRLTQAAQEFVADQNTDDREELVIRAMRLMRDRTASWDRDTAQDTVREFVSAVAHAASRAQRVASRPVVEVFDDFDDHLMFA